MRSLTLSLISTLLLSPISVLATYHHDGEHQHHPDHHDWEQKHHPDHHDWEQKHHPDHHDEHSGSGHRKLTTISVYPTNHYDDDLSHHPDHGHKHSKGRYSKLSNKKVARIAVTIEYPQSDVDYICKKKERSCSDRNDCSDDKKSCKKKHKCHEEKRKCSKEFECSAETRKCYRKTTNRYGFRCGDKFYNQQKVLKAARSGCKEIGRNKQNIVFPALHTAYEFDYEGPYVEWPITHYGIILRKFTKPKHRLVMTMDCAVVGAVVRRKGGKYSKCKYERQ